MSNQKENIALERFTTFGELLRYARKRTRLTQRELAAQVGYHHSYVSYLEKNLRVPEEAVLMGRFVPALGLEDEPEVVARLLELIREKKRKSLIPALMGTESIVSQEKAGSLPINLTSMVGRESESALLHQMLASPDIRLITIVGPPGVGKTRLAVHAAEQAQKIFVDGVVFVNLTPIHQTELVIPAIAAVLGDGNLEAALHEKQLLILLDNFEQVVDAAPQLIPLLGNSPGLKIMATSRETLRVNGEHEFPLAPLPVPDKSFLDSPAVQLFMERARTVEPSFQVDEKNASRVADICRRLDGLPLAIELAAARIRTLSLTAMLEQFDRRFDWLTRGGRELPAWRQTLWGAIQWSYALLSEPERELLNRLSVFAGGWTLGAAEEICSDELLCTRTDILNLLIQLADKSLVVAEPDKERYYFLETLREFAQEKLSENKSLERIQPLHCEYYLKFIKEAHSHLVQGANQAGWFNLVENDYDNLRVALGWATASTDRAVTAMEFGRLINPFWSTRSLITEARHWLTIILELNSTPTPIRSELLRFASDFASVQGDYKQASSFQNQVLEISRILEDDESIFSSMDSMAILAGRQGDYAQAAELLEQALVHWRNTNNLMRLTSTLNNLSIASRRLGRLERARQLLTESIILARETGNQRSLAHALLGLAEVHLQLKEYIIAMPLQRESIAIRHQIGSLQGVAFSLSSLATSIHHMGNSFLATQFKSASDKMFREIGVVVSSTTVAERENFQKELQAKLGKIEFKKAWEQGQALVLADVVNLAMQGGGIKVSVGKDES